MKRGIYNENHARGLRLHEMSTASRVRGATPE